MTAIDEAALNTFVGKMLGDLGGIFSVPTVRIGLRLGLFEALHDGGPATATELATRTGGLAVRYVREWALAQAANGYEDGPEALRSEPLDLVGICHPTGRGRVRKVEQVGRCGPVLVEPILPIQRAEDLVQRSPLARVECGMIVAQLAKRCV